MRRETSDEALGIAEKLITQANVFPDYKKLVWVKGLRKAALIAKGNGREKEAIRFLGELETCLTRFIWTMWARSPGRFRAEISRLGKLDPDLQQGVRSAKADFKVVRGNKEISIDEALSAYSALASALSRVRKEKKKRERKKLERERYIRYWPGPMVHASR